MAYINIGNLDMIEEGDDVRDFLNSYPVLIWLLFTINEKSIRPYIISQYAHLPIELRDNINLNFQRYDIGYIRDRKTASFFREKYPLLYLPPYEIRELVAMEEDDERSERTAGYLYWILDDNEDFLRRFANMYFHKTVEVSNYGNTVFFIKELNRNPNNVLFRASSYRIVKKLLEYPNIKPNVDHLTDAVKKGNEIKVSLLLKHPSVNVNLYVLLQAMKTTPDILRLVVRHPSSDSVIRNNIEAIVDRAVNNPRLIEVKMDMIEILLQNPILKDNKVLSEKYISLWHGEL